MKNTMTQEQEELLNEIHGIALSEDHLEVPFSMNALIMANRVIDKMKKKLLNIADLLQVLAGD